MASPPILARFQLKRDTTINWSNSIVPLQTGEPGYDYELKILKIGNGSDLWNKLPSIGGASALALPMTISLPSSPFIEDKSIRLNTIYTGVPTTGRITLLKNSATVYSQSVSLPLSTTGEYTLALPETTNFIYDNTYKIDVTNSSGIIVGSLDNIHYQPSGVNLNIVGEPFMVSPFTIGINYNYTGPNIKDITAAVSIDDFLTTSTTLTFDITRSYPSSSIRTLYITKAGTSTYSNGVQYKVKLSYNSISSISSQFTFSLPTITSISFNSANNRLVDIQLSTPVIASVVLTITNGSTRNTTSTTAPSTSTNSYLNLDMGTYPSYGTVVFGNLTFPDGRSIRTDDLQFRVMATFNGSPSYSTNLSGFIPNIKFEGLQSIILRVIRASSTTEYTDFLITIDSCTQVSQILDPSHFNTSYYTYSLPITASFLVFPNNYRFQLLNSDSNVLSYIEIPTSGSLSIPTIPDLSSNTSASISSGISWSNANLRFTNIRADIIERATGNIVGYVLNYDTNNGTVTIPLSSGSTFSPGSIYFVKFTLPDNTTTNSPDSLPYVSSYISSSFTTNTNISCNITWISGSNSVELQIFNATDSTTTTSSSGAGSTIIRNKTVGASTDIFNISPSGRFNYNNWYIVKAIFKDGSNTIISTQWSTSIQYTYTATITNPIFTRSPNIFDSTLTFSNSIGNSDINSNIIYIQVLSYVPSIGIESDSVSTTGINGTSIGSTNNILNISLPGITFSRGTFYYLKVFFNNPDSGGTLIATSPNAIRYNPIDIGLTTNNFGVSYNSIGFTATPYGPSTNYEIKLYKNATSVATTTRLVAGTTPPSSLSYTFDIQKSDTATSSLNKYYLEAVLYPTGATLTTRDPASPSTNTYIYDSSATSLQSVTPSNGNGVNIDGSMLQVSLRWKGYSARAYVVIYVGNTSTIYGYMPMRELANYSNLTTISWNDSIYSDPECTTARPLTSGSYSAKVLLNSLSETDAILGPVTFIYTATRCTITSGTVTNSSITLNFNWSGNATLTPLSITIRDQSNTNIIPNSTITSSITSQTYNGLSLSSQTTYTARITLPDSTTATLSNIRFIPTTASLSGSFRDDGADLGCLLVTTTVNTSYVGAKLKYSVNKYADSSPNGNPSNIYISPEYSVTNGVAVTPLKVTNDKFLIESYYNVDITVNDSNGSRLLTQRVFSSANTQYTPKGYDILVFAGQSNMVGRDDGLFYSQQSVYKNPVSGITFRVPYETSKPPQYTDDVEKVALVDKNRNNVKTFTDVSPTTLIDFKAPLDSSQDNMTSGVSQAYQFTNYYANSNNILKPYRRVGVVFEPKGGSGFPNWSAPSGNLYTNLKNKTNQFSDEIFSQSGYSYSCNRVVVFVWHQGEANTGVDGWNVLVDTMVQTFMTQTSPLSSPNYTSFILGNLEILTSLKIVDNSSYGSGTISLPDGSNVPQKTLLENALSVPTQIDAYPDLKVYPYKTGTYSSLGLMSIDQNSPMRYIDSVTPYTTLIGPQSYSTYGTDVHFSARSERLLGLRAFKSFLRVSGYNTSANQFGALIPTNPSTTTPSIITYNFDSQTLNFDSSAISDRTSNNPVAYLVSAINSVQPSPVYFILTEYNAYQNKYIESSPPASEQSSTKTCYIPFYTYKDVSNNTLSGITNNSTGSIRFQGSAAAINFTILSANVDTTGSSNVPVFAANDIVTKDYLQRDVLTAKPLISYIGPTTGSSANGLFDLVENPPSGVSRGEQTSRLATSNFTLKIQSIYSIPNVNPNGTISRSFTLDDVSYSLPPIISKRLLSLGSLMNSPSLNCIDFSDRWVVSPNSGSNSGNGTPILVGNAMVGNSGGAVIMIAGCASSVDASGISGYETGETITVGEDKYSVVGIKTFSNLNSIIFPPNYRQTWSFNSRNGLRYTRLTRGLDWSLFFSEGHYNTRSITPSNYPDRPGMRNSPLYGLQFSGIAYEGNAPNINPTGPSLQSLLGLSNPPCYYYMYGTGCGFILQLRNIQAGKLYRINYYISTRPGRVPHNRTMTTPKFNIGSDTITDYDCLLTNPLEVRLFTTNPISNAAQTEYFVNTTGQDVHFGIGSNSATSYMTTTNIHNGGTWDGSWKSMSFRFRFPIPSPLPSGMSADGSYTYNNAFIKFGPLPSIRNGVAEPAAGVTLTEQQLEYMNTSINIGGISVVIDNTI